MRIDICDLGKIDMILGMLWLQAHNPEINWKIRKVKMIKYSPLCGRTGQKKEERKVEKGKRIVTLEKEKIVRWAIDNKEDWGREKKICHKLHSAISPPIL